MPTAKSKTGRVTHVVMLAYTIYPSDARVRREAETMAGLPGYRVSVVVLKESPRPRRYRLSGVEVVELNLLKYRGKSKAKYFLSYFHYLFRALGVCTRLLSRGRLDIVHVHNMPNFLVFSAILPKICGKPLILDIHDSMPETYAAKFVNSENRPVFRLLSLEETVCSRLADRVICVNHVQMEAIAQRGIPAGKITVSLNVPDPRWFSNGTRPPASAAGAAAFNLVYHGTITKRLGVDLGIRAVAVLVEKIPGIAFHVLGTGDDLEECSALARSLGVEHAVHFNRRMIPVDDLMNRLKDMHLGIIANRRNIATELMLPVKMLEYVALGIPVVAPELKAIRHYFNGQMVRFFTPDRAEELAACILDLYRNPQARRQQADHALSFLETFGWPTHKQDLIGLYQSLGGAH